MILLNKVLVSLHRDSSSVLLDGDTPLYWTVAGVVQKVGRPLFIRDPGYPLNHARLALFEAGQECLGQKIYPGDEVLIDYTALFEVRGESVLVPHSAIICRINPVVAINGNIIVEIDDSTEAVKDGVMISYDRRKVEGVGIVVSCPRPAKRKYGPDDPRTGANPGDQIWFRNGWRIESDILRRYGPLVCVKPRDVYAIQPKNRD